MPGGDFHLGPKLSIQQQDDIAFGVWQPEVSRLEIGQSIVVKEGTVLAVEGFEERTPASGVVANWPDQRAAQSR